MDPKKGHRKGTGENSGKTKKPRSIPNKKSENASAPKKRTQISRRDEAQKEEERLVDLLGKTLKLFPPQCSENCDPLRCNGVRCTHEASKAELEVFEAEHLNMLKKQFRTGPGKKTLLHIMIQSWSKEAWSPKQKGFLCWMLQQPEFRSQLEYLDEEGSTPMHKALSKRLDEFVSCVLEAKGLRSIMNILKASTSAGNCLHLATKYNFPYLEDMIKICADDSGIFMAESKLDKNTPLHVAVQHLNLLVEDRPDGGNEDSKSDQEPQEQLGEDSDTDSIQIGEEGGQSNIAGHEFDEDDGNFDPDYAPDGGDDGSSLESSYESDLEDEELEAEEIEEPARWTFETEDQRRDRLSRVLDDLDKKTKRPKPPRAGYSGNHLTSLVTTKNATQVSTDLPPSHSVRQLILACPEALGQRNEAKRTPYQEREHVLFSDALVQEMISKYARQHRGEDEEEGRDEKVEERERRAKRMIVVNDPVAHYIRSFCVRHFKSRDEAISRLYKPGHECHIEFDLAGMPEHTISQTYLTQLAMHLKFESILKYVAIPALSIEPQTLRKARSRASQSDERPLPRGGRSDLVIIFDWLWDNGVREIIKVMVVDDRDQPHADGAIVEALYGFKVEEWDWKRLDLCSDVICEASPTVKEVSLYSSGNNAVLMGWASAEGLGNREKFPQLEKVNMFVKAGLEDSTVWRRNTEKCKEMIERNGRTPNGKEIEVKVVADKNKVSFSSEFHNAMDGKDPPWIESIQSFSSFLKAASGTPGKVTPVKIAIIDDGIDVGVVDLQSKIAGGATFCPYPHSSEFVNSYFVPSGKHGTLMAQMICRLCPSVQLYIARLEELPASVGSGRRVTARSAAKAVNWAINCGVSIISMSWTIQTTAHKHPDMVELQNAINRAHNANILMFCSASDQGGHTPGSSFPGYWQQCLRIGGATFAGDKLTWVEDTVDFWFPGRNVPFPSNDGKTVLYESGSSVATAAATGLAAVLIYAARLVKGSGEDGNVFQDKNVLRTAFEYMAKGSDRKFPRVTEILSAQFKMRLRRKMQSSGAIERARRDFSIDVETLKWDRDSEEALRELIEELTTGVR